MKDHDKPTIGISLGDMNGIGPEIILKTFLDTRMMDNSTPVVYGSAYVLNTYKKILHLPDLQLNSIKDLNEAKKNRLNVIDVATEKLEVQPGKPDRQSGSLALAALDRAIEDALSGSLNGIVTAPLSKEYTALSHEGFIGHTEYIANKCGQKALMMLCSEKLRISMVTTHIPLNKVAEAITEELVIARIELMHRSLQKDFGVLRPKIAILGLNPHAGEGGLLGKEEGKILIPAINQVKTKGILAFGPYPSDGFFGNQSYLQFDGVLAMYHDQALIPFKTISFEDGVNFTAGLKIVRTSPDHGTAFEIAGSKVASEMSFRSAIFQACSIIKERQAAESTVSSD